MGIFSNIVSTIKRNTLDKTDLDERIMGGVKKAFTPAPMVSPQARPTPMPTPMMSPTPQPNRPMPSSSPMLPDRPKLKTEPALRLSQRLDQIKRNITGNLPTWGQAAKNVTDVFTKPLVPGRPSIVEAARMTAPTVAKDFGDMMRKAPIIPEPVKQMVGNTAEHIGNATVNSVMGIDDILQGKKVQGAFRTLKGAGQFATAAMPLNTAVNVASQVGTDKTKRIATGMQRGMSMVDTLSPNTKENKWIKGDLPVVGKFEIDPLVAGGQMVGFTKNALNQGIYKVTNKYIPMEYNTISKWIAGNGTRGGIENLIQTLDQMPEDPKEQIPFLVSTFGMGAVMELGGQAINRGTKKVLTTKVAQKALNQLKKFQAYANEPILDKVSSDIEGGFTKFARVPRWQVIAKDINRVLGDKLPIGMTIKNVKGEGTGFPRIGDSWDAAVADAEQVIKNGDLTPEQANEVIPQTAIRNHIAAIVDLVESKIGRQLSPEELTTFSKDYTIYRSNGDTGEALVSDNYLKSRFGYDERSIANILKNRKTQPGSTLANADETRMVDSEPAWTPRKTYTNNAPPDKGLLEGFDANGNPLKAPEKKTIANMSAGELMETLNPSKRPVEDILTPEGQLQMKAEAIASEFNIPDKVEAIKAQLEKGLTPAQVRQAIDEHLTKTIGDNYPEVTGAHSTPSVDDPVIKPHKPQSTLSDIGGFKSAEELGGKYSITNSGLTIGTEGGGKFTLFHEGADPVRGISKETTNELDIAQKAYESSKGTGIENVRKAKQQLENVIDKAIREAGIESEATVINSNGQLLRKRLKSEAADLAVKIKNNGGLTPEQIDLYKKDPQKFLETYGGKNVSQKPSHVAQAPKPQSTVGGKESFSNTTGNKMWDKILSKGEAHIVYMTPDEFLSIQKPLTTEEIKLGFKEINPTNKRVQYFVNKIKNGETLNIPILDKENNWFDGIHRALAAKEAGLKKIPVIVADNIEPVKAEPRKWNIDQKPYWDNPNSNKPTRFEPDIQGTLGKLEVMDEGDYTPTTLKSDVRDLRNIGFTADEIRDVISGKRSAFDIFKAEHPDVAPTKQTIDQILTSKTPTPEPKVKVEEKVIDSKTGLEKALEEVNAQALKRNARLDAQAKRLTKKYGISENELIRLRENKNGEFNISAKDQAVLDSISNYLADANGIPQEGRLPNHFPHLDVTRPERMTPSSSYAGRIAGTYDPAMTRRNLIPEENLVGSVEAWKQSGYSADQKRYGDVFQAKTIMEENNLPREKGDEVLEAVKKQGEKVKSLEEGHLKNTTFNQVGDVDYLKDTRAFDDEIARIAGKPIDRPVIKARMKTLLSKAVDASVNVVRGDNNVIQQRTNPEVFNAYKIMRDSNLPNSRTNHGKALENFVKVASNYEYEDKQVEGIINLIIDNEIKTGKVKKSLYTQTFRLITGIFSGAHIGGNVKTIITQPTELYRVAAEEGAGNLAKGFQTVFKEAPRLRQDYGLDEMTAQALEANPEYKKVKAESLMDKVSDLNERILNVTMAGMKWSEEWKNTILVAAAEQKGLQKGLEVGSEAMTHFVRDELFRVGHVGSKYSTPQIIKGKGGKAALLQYSQYALKNFVLKYDTILDAEKPALTRAANVFKQVLADTAATLTVAGITGIPIKTALELFSNSQLPTGLGPIYSVPKEMWDEFKQYNTDQANAKPGEEVESLSSRWGNTIQRNFQPFGNQYLKSKGGYEALNKGYGESKKGNVKYATGDLNPIQKAQVLLFGANAIPNKQKSDKAYADLDAGKSTVYPTLGKTESAILKGLPKDQQEAYYNKQQSLQTPISTLLKGETAKKPNLIESILGGKKVEAKSLTDIPDETTTPEELTKFNSYVKAKLDSGIAPTDEELKAYFFAKIDKMPTSTGSETQNKQVELFKKIDSIYESQTLDDATKDKLIGMSGLSKEDVEYYNLAKDDATVKAMREEEKSGTMSREDWLQSLVDRRRMVGNKQIMDNTTINMLYERGVLSDKERDYLNAIKYDPATKKFYLDRDYKGSGSGGMSKSDLNKILNTQQDIFDAAEKLRKTNTKEPEKRQSLTSFVASGKKAQKQTIAQILGKSGKNVLSDITQVTSKSSKMRVKRKYY